MEYKIETSLYDFKAWGGAVDTLNLLKERDDDEAVEQYIEDIFMDEDVTDEMINDFLWFECDQIAEYLGYRDWQAYYEGWSDEDLENADEWFYDLEDVEMYEKITGKKRSDWADGDEGESDFMEACEIWWEAQTEQKKVEIYTEN